MDNIEMAARIVALQGRIASASPSVGEALRIEQRALWDQEFPNRAFEEIAETARIGSYDDGWLFRRA